MSPLRPLQEKKWKFCSNFLAALLAPYLSLTHLPMPLGLMKPIIQELMPLVERGENKLLVTSN
jgi:hypothetical protein